MLYVPVILQNPAHPQRANFCSFILLFHRANFSGGGMSYTEYHAHVTRAVSGMPGIN